MQTHAPNGAEQTIDATSSRPMRWWPWALVVGDLISFVVFAVAGRDSHGEATGFNAISETLFTALPFALGWFLIAPWLGAFRREKTQAPVEMLKRTELAWLCSLPLVLALRWIFSGHTPPLAFVIVLTLFNALFLGGWRTAFAWIVGRVRAR